MARANTHDVFRPLFAAIALVILGATLARTVSDAGNRYHDSLNIEKPALASLSPVVGATSPQLARRVVLVIADGLRLDDSYGFAFLDGLRRMGIDSAAVSHFPTLSRPNHAAAVTGITPLASGIRNNSYNRQAPLDSLMAHLAAVGRRSAFIGDYALSLARLFSAQFDSLAYTPWPGGLVKASRLAIAQGFDLVVIIPGAIDEAGHKHGGISEEYRSAIFGVDTDLSAALFDLDMKRDAIILVADHGHTDRGGHGGLEPEVVNVPLIMAGAGIRPGALVQNAELIDIAPTVAALLGIACPGHAMGRVLSEALTISPEAARTFAYNDTERQLALRKHILRSASIDDTRASNQKIDRMRISVLGLLVGLLAIWLGWKTRALKIDIRVLLFGLPAFTVTYYMLLKVIGGFSLSALRDRENATQTLYYFGLVSTVIHVVMSWFSLQGRRLIRDRLAAANGLCAVGLWIACAPAALFWTLYPGPFPNDLPSSVVLILVPATFVAVSCFCIGSLVTLVLEIVVFFARALDPTRWDGKERRKPTPRDR